MCLAVPIPTTIKTSFQDYYFASAKSGTSWEIRFFGSCIISQNGKMRKKCGEFHIRSSSENPSFFNAENKELEKFKAEKTGSGTCLLEPWEVGYWAEKLKKERYDFDDEDLRPYFPIQSVLDGMFNLVTKIFGLKIVERSTLLKERNASP